MMRSVTAASAELQPPGRLQPGALHCTADETYSVTVTSCPTGMTTEQRTNRRRRQTPSTDNGLTHYPTRQSDTSPTNARRQEQLLASQDTRITVGVEALKAAGMGPIQKPIVLTGQR
eukprot:299929-Rhodomonas_salina.1